ncbi:phytanoyl-CoA dioxygenase family protein [Aquihabitans sp. McL0605]|uniref:phytanoyl-CoA dioxygenase family protein n=1 Tax=Aquihabitans sp. McL0605 TaxID=3415671 RepID=UPI003CFABAF0
MTARPRFRAGALDARLERDGYVVVPGAARRSLRSFRRVHRRVVGEVPPGFDSTLYSGDEQLKRSVHAELLAVFAPLLDELLEGHRPLLTNFVTKGRDPGGSMAPHQDWTFVDEPAHASINVWVPLTRVDHRNGAMSVLPKGHRMDLTIRGTETPNPFEAIEAEAAARMVELPMEAGDVLVHDHRLLHSSPPNLRRRPRVVAGCAVVGDRSELLHYRQAGPGRVERFTLDAAFYTEHTFGAADLPPSATRVAEVDFAQPRFEVADLPGITSREAAS